MRLKIKKPQNYMEWSFVTLTGEKSTPILKVLMDLKALE
jgi:hypothetical protein